MPRGPVPEHATERATRAATTTVAPKTPRLSVRTENYGDVSKLFTDRASAQKHKGRNPLRLKDSTDYTAARAVSPDKPLTDRQRLFVKYMGEGNPVAVAAARAGVAAANIGYRWMQMPNIRRQVEIEQLKYEEASQMTRKKVMDMFLEAYDMAKTISEPSSMIAAAREIGKMCGYYEPVRHQVAVSVSGQVVMERLDKMSDAELLKLITSDSETTTQALEHDETTLSKPRPRGY